MCVFVEGYAIEEEKMEEVYFKFWKLIGLVIIMLILYLILHYLLM